MAFLKSGNGRGELDANRSGRRLRVESLEDRRMLAAVEIDFFTLPGGTPLPGGAEITDEYLSLGVEFSSGSGGTLIQNDGQASSAPNYLIGNPDSFQSIQLDFTDLAAQDVGMTLISVGDATVTATAYAGNFTTVIDSVSISNPGAGDNFGGQNSILLEGGGIRRIVVEITTVFPGDGFGIDDLFYDFSTEAAPQVTGVYLEPGPIAIGQNEWYTEADQPTAIIVSFDEELSTVGGDSGAASVINPVNWLLTRDGVDVSSEITGIVQSFNATESRWEAALSFTGTMADGSYTLTLADDVTDLAGNSLDGDFVRSFVIAVGPVKLGDEFPVNTFTTGHQQDASIAMDAAGNSVVVWASFNQDGGGYGVYGQRYNAAGEAQGDEFLVNTTTDGNQQMPIVAMDDDGDFVVIFDMSSVGGGNDGLYYQRYNAAGEKQGGQVRISEAQHSGLGQHDIAMDSDGNFVVAWWDFGTGETGGIFAQLFNASGDAQTAIFRVNTFTSLTQEKPAAAMDADGDFAIVWQSQNQDGSGLGVFGQRYNALGVAQGSEFPVNTFTTGEQSQADIGMDVDGNFVVVWYSAGGPSGAGVYGQRYSASGMAQDGEFFVAASNATSNTLPAVAMDADGDFVVTFGRSVGGTDGRDLFGRRFSATGEPLGEEFEVNTYQIDDQDDSDLAMHPDGNFVVAWESENQDGNNLGIYSQRFIVNMPPATGLPGDYNGDGFVNAADFPLWRDTLGDTTNLVANGNDSNSVIDEADYDVWVENFGAAAEMGTGSGARGVSAATAGGLRPPASGAIDAAFAMFDDSKPGSTAKRAATLGESSSAMEDDALLLLATSFADSGREGEDDAAEFDYNGEELSDEDESPSEPALVAGLFDGWL